jgi:hypothetical protein
VQTDEDELLAEALEDAFWRGRESIEYERKPDTARNRDILTPPLSQKRFSHSARIDLGSEEEDEEEDEDNENYKYKKNNRFTPTAEQLKRFSSISSDEFQHTDYESTGGAARPVQPFSDSDTNSDASQTSDAMSSVYLQKPSNSVYIPSDEKEEEMEEEEGVASDSRKARIQISDKSLESGISSKPEPHSQKSNVAVKDSVSAKTETRSSDEYKEESAEEMALRVHNKINNSITVPVRN